MRTRILVLSVVAASTLSSCGRAPAGSDTASPAVGRAPDAREPGPATASTVALVDSVPYENELTSGHLRRVVVQTGARADTLTGILVAEVPVVGADGAIYGIDAAEDRATGLFAFDPRTRQVRRLRLPRDWWAATKPQVAPDGRHVAYLARTGDGDGYAAVAALPSGELVYRGPAVTMLETDAGVDAIHWIDAAQFEIRVALSSAVGGTQRVRGSVMPATAHVDTLRPPAG